LYRAQLQCGTFDAACQPHTLAAIRNLILVLQRVVDFNRDEH